MKNEQRIIITGGNGFIGSALLDVLILFNYKPIVLDKKKSKNKEVDFFIGDFFDKKLLNKIIKKNDIVIHLACTTIPATSELNRQKDVRENIIGTLNLLDVCAQKQIKKFIFVSSGGTVYGNIGKKKAKENMPCNPINSHGVMKLTIENYIKIYSRLYNLKYVILRGANPYGGKSKKTQGIIDVFFDKIQKQQNLEIWGDGSVVRDYIYIDDFIDAFLLIIKNNIFNKIYNIGTGKAHSINDIIKIISKILNKKIKVKYKQNRNFDLPYNVLDVSLIQKELNWQAKTSLKKGLSLMYENIKNKK